MEKILITGAGGFIGGRLVEMLKETTRPEINILLRTLSKAARISTYPLHYFKGNVTDEGSLNAAMQGCDAVVHCAHEFANPAANLQAIDLVAGQCLKLGVKKLVYISSFAVHRGDEETINEESALNDQWDYAVNKTAIEKKLREYHRQSGLPVIILRPTIVYGPFSAAWTIHTVNQMLAGRLVIPHEGSRVCNAVYVDDVAAAIIRAIDAPDSCHGKTYIVSGPDTVTWKEFYNAHLDYAGTQEPVYMSREESGAWQARSQTAQPSDTRASLLKDPITFLKKTPVYTIYQGLLKNSFFRKKLLSAKTAIPRPLIYPDKNSFDTLSCSGRVDLKKMKDELGYIPRTPFREGISKTLRWIRWANLNMD
jgi:nucleoside-diphosphate-sugar epimerase